MYGLLNIMIANDLK